MRNRIIAVSQLLLVFLLTAGPAIAQYAAQAPSPANVAAHATPADTVANLVPDVSAIPPNPCVKAPDSPCLRPAQEPPPPPPKDKPVTLRDTCKALGNADNVTTSFGLDAPLGTVASAGCNIVNAYDKSGGGDEGAREAAKQAVVEVVGAVVSTAVIACTEIPVAGVVAGECAKGATEILLAHPDIPNQLDSCKDGTCNAAEKAQDEAMLNDAHDEAMRSDALDEAMLNQLNNQMDSQQQVQQTVSPEVKAQMDAATAGYNPAVTSIQPAVAHQSRSTPSTMPNPCGFKLAGGIQACSVPKDTGYPGAGASNVTSRAAAQPAATSTSPSRTAANPVPTCNGDHCAAY